MVPGIGEDELSLQGLKYLKSMRPLVARLHNDATARDRAGNRQLYYDQLCGLILLSFFNPTLVSLRDLKQASALEGVKRKLGCRAASLGSLSEAMRVFDADRLVEIIQDLLGRLPEVPTVDPGLKELAHIPTAVDGSLLKKLPQITQACFATRSDRGWKLHTHFEVLRGVPVAAAVTDASGEGAAGEKPMLRTMLSPDRCYLTDRGYEEFSLFNAIVAAGSSYVCRVREDHHFTRESEQTLSEDAQAAGVLEDAVGRMGSPRSKRIEHPDHDQRRIVIRCPEHPKRGGRRRSAGTKDIVVVTNLRDIPAETIALLYRYRWMIELFFRWLKCVLQCRHLMSQSENGIEIQMYCALIACLLVQLAAGQDVRPNQWTYKLLTLYASGWASEEDVLRHLRERTAARQK
ncbi:MAG: IS4 family transposase [Planctomycetaceae bacterium]|nr:IS4 family transposase [Planctomycetaceae bacterium]